MTKLDPSKVKQPKHYTWKAEVTITIDPCWVADGFNLTEERLRELIEYKLLDYANEDEKKVEVKIIDAPNPDAIAIEQSTGWSLE